jgi:hypothetical protein
MDVTVRRHTGKYSNVIVGGTIGRMMVVTCTVTPPTYLEMVDVTVRGHTGKYSNVTLSATYKSRMMDVTVCTVTFSKCHNETNYPSDLAMVDVTVQRHACGFCKRRRDGVCYCTATYLQILQLASAVV